MKVLFRSLALSVGLLTAGSLLAADLPPALAKKLDTALTKGGQYLIETQEDNGSWGELPHPATAALCGMAISTVKGLDPKAREEAVKKAMGYLLEFKQPDGSVYPAQGDKSASANYPNYTTSIALMAMGTAYQESYLPLIRKARAYIRDAQFKDESKTDFGGLGYGHSGRADLSNAGWAAEALHFTAWADQEPNPHSAQLAKENADTFDRFQAFVTICQNDPTTNSRATVSTDPVDLGGFAYMPTASKAGERKDTNDNVPNLISSGSMTAVGLKSLLYAGVPKTDPRVQSAFAYLQRSFTLDHNPGQKYQAWYFYLFALSRALDAYGQETLTLTDGTKLQWRPALIEYLLDLQNADGSWWNTKESRFMESMPELATPYIMLALQTAAGHDYLKHQ